jgi:hypothetical protein
VRELSRAAAAGATKTVTSGVFDAPVTIVST